MKQVFYGSHARTKYLRVCTSYTDIMHNVVNTNYHRGDYIPEDLHKENGRYYDKYRRSYDKYQGKSSETK